MTCFCCLELADDENQALYMDDEMKPCGYSEEVFLESKNLDHPKVTSGAEKCHPNIGLRKPFF